MSVEVLFAGTGTSVGIPMIGCRCSVCTSSDPRNTRCRSSVYLSTPTTAVIIDTPPDFRQQMLRYKIERLNAVVFTHAHADHFLGFDDIRRFNTLMGGVIPAYADPVTMLEIRRVFHYIQETPAEKGLYRPLVDFREITTPFTIGDLKFTPVEVEHGKRMTGYRIDHAKCSMGYVPDCFGISQQAIELFQGLDLMVLDGLRYRPHPQHFDIATSVEVLRMIRARRSLLTHICHDIDHATLAGELPADIQPAYDGLRLQLPDYSA
jgi:phosphoribosyl 1,2-cyclic phosphate phosphodiesterase